MKKSISGKNFFCALLFSVQKVNHNFDLNPKFEQKNFKNEDDNSNSIYKEKWQEKKEGKI